MQIEGLIPLKSSIDQAIASLYFMRISKSFCSTSSVNAAEIITGFAFSSFKKAYFNCLGNSFKVNTFELVHVSISFSSLLLDFFVMFSFKLLLNKTWNLAIHNQDHQDTGNSSHFH